AHRHLLQPHQGGGVRHRGDADPLLLRLQRHRRTRRGRRGVRAGHPALDRHRGGAEPVPLAALLGRRRHGEARMITRERPSVATAPPPRRPPAPRPTFRWVPLVVGPLILALIGAGMFVGLKAAYGGFGHYYDVSVTLPRTGEQLTTGSDVRMHGVIVGKV